MRFSARPLILVAMHVTSRWLVAIALAGTACGSTSDTAGSTDDAAGTDTLHEGDALASDTLVAGDSTPPPDTAGTDATRSDTAGTDTAGTDTATGTDAALGPYPAGPYGGKEGDTVANLQWEGYQDDAADVVASTKPYGKYSMDAARRSGRRYALLHVAEFF